MSTFSGFIPELPGIAIDCFEENHRSEANLFFLSHCHADHMRGLQIAKALPGALYLSPISGVLIRHRFPQHADVVRTFSVREQLALKIEPSTGEEPYELHVRSISAEHCPGSVMFYFETNATRVLYTGDFRLTSLKHFVAQSAEIQPKIVYLDSTFLDTDYSYFPTRDECTHRIVSLCAEWLKSDKRNVLSLWLPANYGSEELFLSLYERLKEKIHISDKQRGPYMHFASLDKVLTDDSSVRIHVCNGTARTNRKLSCRPRSNDDDDDTLVRTIRPSALRWRGLQPNEQYWKESNGLFYVCYSAHASCHELADFLRQFHPAVQDIRFNVVGDEPDRIKKSQVLASILEGGHSRASTNAAEEGIESYQQQSLHLDKIEYKPRQQSGLHRTNNRESSESEDNEDDLHYCKLPKRKCTD